eukprot:gene41078-54419_t
MLTWILECAGLQPGFLVGGVPLNFGVSARLGSTSTPLSKHGPRVWLSQPAGAAAPSGGSVHTQWESVGATFVIEADEYDTAFFDKRSKFVHYRPRTAILNNLEFDHADIFDNLAAIERQFHHLVRTVPSTGRVVVNATEESLERVLAQGCWSEQVLFGTALANKAGSTNDGAPGDFTVLKAGKLVARVQWALSGVHNQLNALATIAAAEHVGVAPEVAAAALAQFQNVRRRLELRGESGGVKVYDDFAHHPTAIHTTINGLRRRLGRDDRHAPFGLERQQGFRLVEGRYTQRVEKGAVREMLMEAAFDGTPIMVFVGSPGCIQIHTGPVQRVEPMEVHGKTWLNVLDPGFNLHLREDLIADVWVVEKPTSDGVVTSVEAFDARGELMAMFFGARKPGQSELAAWRNIVAHLQSAGQPSDALRKHLAQKRAAQRLGRRTGWLGSGNRWMALAAEGCAC